MIFHHVFEMLVRVIWSCLVLSTCAWISTAGYVLRVAIFVCPDWLNGIALVFTQVNHSFSWVVFVVVVGVGVVLDVAGIFVYIFQLGSSSSLHLSIFPLPKVICKKWNNLWVKFLSVDSHPGQMEAHTKEKRSHTMSKSEEWNLM